MPTWNSDQYLKFAEERTRPSIDLVARIPLESPRAVVDLGCGPGNSTAVLARRWPAAAITGIDSSASMLATARAEHPDWQWRQEDIAGWAAASTEIFDVVFANASLQWVADHAIVLPDLVRRVAPGGTLAFQVPANYDAAPHRLMRDLAASARWRDRFTARPREWHVQPPEFYYDVLTPLSARLELWCTDYVHVLDNVEAIVEWYRGTGLRPWLDALADDDARTAFLISYRRRLAPYFPSRPDGRVLFPFRRLFVVVQV
jgi:trans-aconitate 2-methyltransferase